MSSITSLKTNTELHEWQFYLNSQDIWDAMYRDCEQARKSIELEQYIFGKDEIGRRFMELFIKKASEGVKVFIICDKFGSMEMFGSSLVRRLRRNGGHFRFFNPISRWHIFVPWMWFPRTHVKALLVDSTVAYVGSACMASYMKGWRDTQIRITGPIVDYIDHSFASMEYSMINHVRPDPIDTPPKEDAFRYVVNQPRLSRFRIYSELMEAISDARDYIYISAAYFVPHNRFFNVLKTASSRGVRIVLLVPEKSDVALADWICLSYANRLWDAGVQIFLYQKSNLHCKTAVIDDNWCTIGSANFDVISFFHNREANMVITDKAVVAELKQHFMNDLLDSKEWTRKDWQHLSVWKKIAGYCARMLKVFF